ncbi:MAG: 50S ribosomal protein L22 [Coriobacteriaceae bacterium]|nr:50S ribosomal protein L22 [Coriobacteriaceae bacterium]
MEAEATAKYLRLSPRKARIVVDQVRGKDVVDALDLLRFNERAASEIVYKVVASAASNAMVKHGLRQENLVISQAYVNEGPTLKRYRPRAKGMAGHINKRTCHITIVVSNREEA